MNTNKAIHYTDAGKKRLDELHESVLRQIESELRDRKYVPGDDAIEVTAADIDELSRSMSVRFYTRDEGRLFIRDLVTRVYMVSGVVLVAVGVFYPYIRTNILGDPTRTMLLATGSLTVAASYFMRAYFRRRDMRREQWTRQFDRLPDDERRTGNSP